MRYFMITIFIFNILSAMDYKTKLGNECDNQLENTIYTKESKKHFCTCYVDGVLKKYNENELKEIDNIIEEKYGYSYESLQEVRDLMYNEDKSKEIVYLNEASYVANNCMNKLKEEKEKIK